MKTILLLLLLAGCATLKPHVVGRADIGKGGSIVLLDSACNGKVAGIIAAKARPEFREGWRTADGVFFMLQSKQLKRFAGCWRDIPLALTRGEPSVFLVFEDEDTMIVPRDRFDGRPHASAPEGLRI